MSSRIIIRLILWGLGLGLSAVNVLILGDVFLNKKQINKNAFINYGILITIQSLILTLVKGKIPIFTMGILMTIVGINIFYEAKSLYKISIIIVIFNIIYMCNLFGVMLLECIFSISGITSIPDYIKYLIVDIWTWGYIFYGNKKWKKIIEYHKSEIECFSNKTTFILIISGIIYFFALCIMQYIYIVKISTQITIKSVVPLAMIYLMAFGGVLFLGEVYGATREAYEDKEHNFQSNLFQRQVKVYKAVNILAQEEEQLKKVTKRSIECIIEEIDKDKLEVIRPILEKIQKSVSRTKTYIVTGNTLLDMVMNEKYEIACQKQIEMKANISLPEKLGIGSTELCMLLNDSLDYALSRCEDMPDGTQKSITVEGIWYKGYLMFKLYYSVPEKKDNLEINSEEKLQKSISEDPYGLGIVAKNIYRYNGELELNTCKWGEEKLTFNFNTTHSLIK